MQIYFLDLETTGLSPDRDAILEIAISQSTLEDPFNAKPIFERVFPVPSVVELSPFIVDVHTKNSLLAECAKATMFPLQIEDELLELIPAAEGVDPETGRPNLHALAGNSVHFDLGFLRVGLPRLAKRFSHRLYDVSAIGLFCRSLGMPKFKKAEAHRAAADVAESIEMARSCAEWLRKGPARELTDLEKDGADRLGLDVSGMPALESPTRVDGKRL